MRQRTAQQSGWRLPERAALCWASPFGIVLRKKEESSPKVSFATWTYQPSYFPPPTAFEVGVNSDVLGEPLCIYAPFIEPPAESNGESTGRTFSSVKIYCPVEEPSAVLANVSDIQELTVVCGEPHLMEISLGERTGYHYDFRPHIPLIIQA